MGELITSAQRCSSSVAAAALQQQQQQANFQYTAAVVDQKQ
jgi:hypothetical protein